jgi:hypothetical protein
LAGRGSETVILAYYFLWWVNDGQRGRRGGEKGNFLGAEDVRWFSLASESNYWEGDG